MVLDNENLDGQLQTLRIQNAGKKEAPAPKTTTFGAFLLVEWHKCVKKIIQKGWVILENMDKIFSF